MALIVKKSRLPNAGKGLFTTKAIEKGTLIIEYRGEIIRWKQYRKRVLANKDGYLLFISRKKCVDAFSTPQYKARYANDAAGLVRIKGVRNNCQYEIHDNKGYIVSIRNIPAGGEIYVDYTKQYWDVMRKNIRDEKLQKAKELKTKKKQEARELKKKKELQKKKAAAAKRMQLKRKKR